MKKKLKSKSKPKAKTKTQTKWIERVKPVVKTYETQYPTTVIAYEDGLQVCRFDCQNTGAFERAVFHLQALAYKEEKK